MSVRAAARRLRLDAAALEAVDALGAAGIDVLLVKGPVTAAWLYAGDDRPYIDVDLVVAPITFDRARATLAGIGFASVTAVPVSNEIELARDADGTTVDLHRAIKEVRSSPAAAWPVLWAHREPFALHGRVVQTLDEPARLVHLCAHAVATGATKDKPRADLVRGVERVDVARWHDAVAVADALDSRSTMASALALHGGAGGRALAAELGLDGVVSRYERLRAVDGGGVLAMGRKLVRGDATDRRALVRGWLTPEPARLERRLQRHDVPAWIRRRPPTRATLLLLFPVLVARSARALARAAISRRR